MSITQIIHCAHNSSGGGDGTTWNLSGPNAAFNAADILSHISSGIAVGHAFVVKEGTYVFSSDADWNTTDATAISPILMFGVKAETTNLGANIVYSDWSQDEVDFPVWDMGVNRVRQGDYAIFRNISVISADLSGIYTGEHCIIENCTIYNDSATPGYDGILMSAEAKVIRCDVESESGSGIIGSNFGGCQVLFNFIHDCDSTNYSGLDILSSNTISAFNIFSNCYNGIKATSIDNALILNDTFYDCDNGIIETDGDSWVLMNNVMEGNSIYGFRWTTQTDSNFFWGNHGDNTRCTDIFSNVDDTTFFQDYEITTGDPDFDTPGSDFKISNSSPCHNTGQGVKFGV